MTTIRLHDARTRRKEAFAPLDPGNVRMYVCGPTVYDRAHLGNARPVVVFDVLYRLLRHVYGADHVTYVRNVTDVDDKINARAAATGRPIRDITDETLRWFHEDMAALGALPPTHEPRATEWVPAMVAMIEALVARGHAYEAHGHVLFRVRSYGEYGQLSGRSVDDMIAGARVEVAPWKEDPLDFVLWKPSDDATPGWESPWGRGRPGWHIECSAMARGLLGGTFDIHGGGLDLQFPHHENEIAQSRCAHPDEGFARMWMHNEMLLVDGRKMSKSLGNFFTVRQVLDGDAVASRMLGEEVRIALLLSHHRSPMDFGVQRRHEARQAFLALATALGRFGPTALAALERAEPPPDVVAALADDLNTPEAVRLLLASAQADAPEPVPFLSRLHAGLSLLGLDLLSGTARDVVLDRAASRPPDGADASSGISIAARRLDAARAARDFAGADRLRAALIDAGLEVRSTRDGTVLARLPHFDPARLERALGGAT